MPEYIYRCKHCHIDYQVTEPMIITEARTCKSCGRVMSRKPQHVRVNWNGMRPSQGELHPNIKQLIDDAPRRREEEHA